MRGYLVQVNRQGCIKLIREDINQTELASAEIFPRENYNLKVAVKDDTITIMTNGTKILEIADPCPLPPGGVGFDVSCPGSALFSFLAISSS